MKATWIVALACCSGAPPPSPPSNVGGTPAKPVPETVDGLRDLLAPHAAYRFTAQEIEWGCPDEQSLGEYLALLVHEGTTAADPFDTMTDVYRLTANCTGTQLAPNVEPKPDPAYAYCTIDSYRSDAAGESPWHYELRFRVRRADLTIDVGNFACPGV